MKTSGKWYEKYVRLRKLWYQNLEYTMSWCDGSPSRYYCSPVSSISRESRCGSSKLQYPHHHSWAKTSPTTKAATVLEPFNMIESLLKRTVLETLRRSSDYCTKPNVTVRFLRMSTPALPFHWAWWKWWASFVVNIFVAFNAVFSFVQLPLLKLDNTELTETINSMFRW